MSALRDALPQYISLRRALGTKLQEPATTLEHFVEFLEREGVEFITSELALRWAMQPQDVQRATWARRLGMVRRFAAWFSTIDARTEVPPHRLLAPRRKRNKPHIFTAQEIGQLMAEAARLASPTGLRALTYTTLIGLLTATGLRPGEALTLDRSDVDLENGILAIRQSKFGKSRFVPISDSTREALREYAKQRDVICRHPRTDAFLVSERGGRLRGCTARRTFARISCIIGLRTVTGSRRIGRGPRLQDFRHCFATRKLIEWYRAGVDVARELPKLTTYLGHVDVAHTYWYLEAVPELLQLATERMAERRTGGGQ
ncbi:MAG: tyrosine-type recombinase/integrase [Bryobacterales bacterium]|nr:tyrosine-type recombinase/integrase [Bryobacterales bacterium]MBV9398098.1 tyrosine-type recombinase/integrase [Bryobacterales bacterium]